MCIKKTHRDVALVRGGLRSHSGTWRQHKKEPDCRAAPATVPSPAVSGSSDNRDEPLRSRDSRHSGSRESSSQRKESLTTGGSRRGSRAGSRESLSGRRESERRAVASDEGPTTVRRERSSSSVRRGSPREEPLRRGSPREEGPRRGSPKEESLRRSSPGEEPLPPVPSSGRVSRSIENVLCR